MMKIDVITLFPEMIEGGLGSSLIHRAEEAGLVQIRPRNFRQFAVNKHGHVDDYPYGGGAGMLLRVEPLVKAIEEAKADARGSKSLTILMDPAGEKFDQAMAIDFSTYDQLIFVCGHYEGYDERIKPYVDKEVSIGDVVLTGGELPAMVMIDATVRLLDDVLGNADSTVDESHMGGLLEYPQYTRPKEFRGEKVPDVLLSGHHENIAKWRHQQSLLKTAKKRPDLLASYPLTEEDLAFLADHAIYLADQAHSKD